MDEQGVVTPVNPETHKVDVLALVGPGLEVYDSLGKKVGKVDSFFGGAPSEAPKESVVVPLPAAPSGLQTVPVMAPVVPVTNTATVPELDTTLHPNDNLPEELRERLTQDGFIRIEAGFLHHHRYALRDQIERVEGDRVILNVVEEELIKR